MNNKTRRSIWFILLVLIVVISGVAVGYLYLQKKNNEKNNLEQYKQETVKRGSISTGIIENGTVSFESVDQIFQIAEISEVSQDASSGASGENGKGSGNTGSGQGQSMGNGTGSLMIEDVYVTTGQIMKQGDPILKLTEDSISDYRYKLEKAAESAGLALQKEEINLELKKTSADYNYQMYLAKGEIAEDNYQATLTNLDSSVAKIEEQIVEQQSEVAAYQEYVDWGYDYGDALEEAQETLETLQANLLIAQNNKTTGSIQAKQEYEQATTNYQYADMLHEIDIDGLDTDYLAAKELLEDAQEALAKFEEQIKDGVVYSVHSGTVTNINIAAGSGLANNTAIATFLDQTAVFMQVYVSQEDITRINTGDQAVICLDAYPEQEFAGTVGSISALARTGSSTVNYEVNVFFAHCPDKIYSGMTGDITFAGKTVTDTLYVSNRAVRLEGAASVVSVLEADGSITEQEIQTGFSDGIVVAVESGLTEGQIVLVEK